MRKWIVALALFGNRCRRPCAISLVARRWPHSGAVVAGKYPERAGPSGGGNPGLQVNPPVAGKPWLAVTNVSIPTLTVYAPKGHNSGTAVVVFPGGGFQVLAMDLEGTEVCDW